ncbi:MAG: hypothetical protein ACSW8B_02495, partial [bacterium]
MFNHHKKKIIMIGILTTSLFCAFRFFSKPKKAVSPVSLMLSCEGLNEHQRQEDLQQIKQKLSLYPMDVRVIDRNQQIELQVESKTIEDLEAFKKSLYYYIIGQVTIALSIQKENSPFVSLERYPLTHQDIEDFSYHDGYQISFREGTIAQAKQRLNTDKFNIVVISTILGSISFHEAKLLESGGAYTFEDAQDPEHQFTELMRYNCTHAPLHGIYQIKIATPVRWENKSLFAGASYQCDEKDIENGMMLKITSIKGAAIKKKDYKKTKQTLKKRLDALQVPYAFGIDFFDEYTMVIKTEGTMLNGTIANLLLIDDATPVIYDRSGSRYSPLLISYDQSQSFIQAILSDSDKKIIQEHGTVSYFAIHDVCWSKEENLSGRYELQAGGDHQKLLNFLEVFEETTYAPDVALVITQVQEDAYADESGGSAGAKMHLYEDLYEAISRAFYRDNVKESMTQEKTIVIQKDLKDQDYLETIKDVLQTLKSVSPDLSLYDYELMLLDQDERCVINYHQQKWQSYLSG